MPKRPPRATSLEIATSVRNRGRLRLVAIVVRLIERGRKFIKDFTVVTGIAGIEDCQGVDSTISAIQLQVNDGCICRVHLIRRPTRLIDRIAAPLCCGQPSAGTLGGTKPCKSRSPHSSLGYLPPAPALIQSLIFSETYPYILRDLVEENNRDWPKGE